MGSPVLFFFPGTHRQRNKNKNDREMSPVQSAVVVMAVCAALFLAFLLRKTRKDCAAKKCPEPEPCKRCPECVQAPCPKCPECVQNPCPVAAAAAGVQVLKRPQPAQKESHFDRVGLQAQQIEVKATTDYSSMVVRLSDGSERTFPLPATGAKRVVDLGSIQSVATVSLKPNPSLPLVIPKNPMAIETGFIRLDAPATTLPEMHLFSDISGDFTVDFRYNSLAPKHIEFDPKSPNLMEQLGLYAWLPNTIVSLDGAYLGVLVGEKQPSGLDVTVLVIAGRRKLPGRTLALSCSFPGGSPLGGIVCGFTDAKNEEQGMVSLRYDREGKLSIVHADKALALDGVPPLPLGVPVRMCVSYNNSFDRTQWLLLHPNGSLYDISMPLIPQSHENTHILMCSDVAALVQDEPDFSSIKSRLGMRRLQIHERLDSVAKLYSVWEGLAL